MKTKSKSYQKKKLQNFDKLIKKREGNAIKDRYKLKEQQFDQTLQYQMVKHREELNNLKENQDKQQESLEINQITAINDRLTNEIKTEITRMENGLKLDFETNSQQTDDLQRQISELTEKIHCLCKNQLIRSELTVENRNFRHGKAKLIHQPDNVKFNQKNLLKQKGIMKQDQHRYKMNILIKQRISHYKWKMLSIENDKVEKNQLNYYKIILN
ncbi:unnamed protein product [Paramecium octaurelia]|nr:unnamed protein product [Paramecium octaurelia]